MFVQNLDDSSRELLGELVKLLDARDATQYRRSAFQLVLGVLRNVSSKPELDVVSTNLQSCFRDKNGPPPPPPGTPPQAEIPAALKPKAVPTSGKKLRHLQWTKIPPSQVAKEATVWQRMASVDGDLAPRLDFSQLEDLFCCAPAASTSAACGADAPRLSQRKSDTVNLLCPKRSLNVNIFLKQFKGPDVLMGYLEEQRVDLIGLERLKVLCTLLPEEEECQTLRGYTGDMALLGTAEIFFLSLLSWKNYRLRLDAMILHEEFLVTVDAVRPQIATVLSACQELKTSRSLQKLLYVVLHMGNFLNHGGNAGNAVGFRLNSLWRIVDLRATRGGGTTLLHLIAMQMADCAEELDKELQHVHEAARLPLESIKAEIKTLSDRVLKMKNVLSTKTDEFEAMLAFLEEAAAQLTAVSGDLSRVETLRQELSIYFCENDKTFRLEECFKIFGTFVSRFHGAIRDNQQREEREHRMRGAAMPHAASNAASSISLGSLKSSPSSSSEMVNSRSRDSVIVVPVEMAPKKRDSGVEDERDRRSVAFESPAPLRRRRDASVSPNDSPLLQRKVRPMERNFSNLESFIDEALQSSSVKPSASRPKTSTTLQVGEEKWSKTGDSKRDSGIDDPISINVNVASSGSTPESSPKSQKTDEGFESDKGSSAKKPVPKKAPAPKPVAARQASVETKTAKTPLARPTVPVQRKPSLASSDCSSKSAPAKATQRVNLSRIRLARQTNEAGDPKASSTPATPTRPSQIVAGRATNSSKTTRPATTSSTTPRTPLSTKPPMPRPTVSRVQSLRTGAPAPKQPLVRTTKPTTTASPRRSAPLTAAERRQTQMRQTNSVSTASRPALIKTGSSAAERPKWI
uniref:FH2 domain-containing protein n=1 Tax=Steinernema glaseri TaxID=37863 RepID=A0A1I7ZSA2_9BILA